MFWIIFYQPTHVFFYFLLFMNVPMYGALATLTWRLSPGNLGLLGDTAAVMIYLGLLALFVGRHLKTADFYVTGGRVSTPTR